MRIKSIYLSEYKNLKDFKLSFDSESFIDVFVGKNGTGKSNLFEAIIGIFNHLYDPETSKTTFDFSIGYRIDTEDVLIEWSGGTLKINGAERKTIGKTPLPENVLIYYSGHNRTVTSLVKDYESNFRRRIKRAEITESPRFIGIGIEYKELLLSVLLLQPEKAKARQFIQSKLGITSVSKTIIIRLERPSFASRGFEIDHFEEPTHYWGALGVTRVFLLNLQDCIKGEYSHSDIYDPKSDSYTLIVDRDLIEKKFADGSANFFNQFHNLKILEMLGGISMPLILNESKEADISYFSDGQFQTVYIYSIVELFKERNCITLLDEPDSFLHPEWQHEFLEQIFEISVANSESNHVLMSSHSASTITTLKDKLISLFSFNGSQIEVSKVSKSEIIRSLSAGLITFSETEARLNIHHALSTTSGPVLFTEGISDEIILETAWDKLYPKEKRKFDIQNAFCCGFLGGLLRREDFYQNHPGRTFFGLFDFDEAYNDWNGLKGDVVESDPCKCLTMKHKKFDGYALLLAPPANAEIRKQVINSKTGEHYKSRSHLTIELLFYGHTGLESHFARDESRPGDFIVFQGDKTRFATKVVPGLPAECFEGFRPVFDFLRSKLS